MQNGVQSRLLARIGRGDGWAVIRLEGVVDEHNGLATLTERVASMTPTLLIDLGGVVRINSVGVRDWVLWLRALDDQHQSIILFDCTTAIMNEVNLVRNFVGKAVISTFAAPYYCERCGRESIEFLDALRMRAEGLRTAPDRPCDKELCDNRLDDEEESYFAFLDDQPETRDRTSVLKLVASAREALARPDATEIGLGPDPAEQAASRRRKLQTFGLTTRPPAIGTSGPAPAVSPGSAPPPPHDLRAPVPPDAAPGGTDIVFILALAAMLVALGVLVYLIMTLE